MFKVLLNFLGIRGRSVKPKHDEMPSFGSPDRKAYAKAVKRVVEDNKEALKALRDR
jgi:hypothetical protein